MPVQFGAIINNPAFRNETQFPTPLPEGQRHWEVRTVYPQGAEQNQPLAYVKQDPASPADVFFFKGKRGDNVIVKTPELVYIGLPGSKIELNDTVMVMPGAPLTGKVDEVFIPSKPTEPQQITKQAMVLCGGLSTRFEPVSGPTTGQAKPSVPLIDDECIARNTIEHLKAHGFNRIIIHTFYLRDKVKEAMRGVEGVELVFLDDPEASGSAGGLYKALKQDMVDRTQPILIIAGDAVTNGDLSELIETHARQQAGVTIGVQQVADEDVNQFGIIQTTDPSGVGSGEIVSFLEKPSLEQAGPNRLGSTGIYVISPEAFDTFLAKGDEFLAEPRDPAKTPVYDYGMHFLPFWRGLKEQGTRIVDGAHMFAQVLRGYWNDVGNPVDYVRTIRDIAEGKLGPELAERMRANTFKDGIVFWPQTQTIVSQSGATLEGNVIVAPKPGQAGQV
jgi:NDP-sugar pyrophosphorylase family protein